MKKPTFVHDLYWTQPTIRFDPDNEVFMSHQNQSVDMTEHGWVKIGVAEITYTIFDNVDPTASQLQAIDNEISRVQVEAQSKVNQLRQKKANLLALPAPAAKSSERDDDIPF
ncbi:MAG: hypothetical protein AB7U98_13690 [Candidatus Nitrosocosmicus sp.]